MASSEPEDRSDGSGTTRPGARVGRDGADAGRLVDNAGAVIQQQIIVQHDGRIGSVSTVEAGGAARVESNLLTPAELASYREAVRARYGVTHFLGFTSPIEYGMTWEELYVELDMVKAHGHSKHDEFAVGAGVEHGEGPGTERTALGLDEAFEYAQRCNKRAMVMLGDPGSGKTTQLQQMLLRVLDEARGPESLGLPEGTVPVLVPIRELSLPAQTEARGAVPRLEALVREALPGTLGGVSEALAARLLEQPCVLLLLDGLDEVPEERARARMAKVIASAQQRLGSHFVMVSSRYAGYADVKTVHLGNGFLELRLEPLRNEQVKGLVHNWHQAVEVMDAREERRAAVPEAAERRAEELLERLGLGEEDGEEERLAQLARSPLLLTALCLIHRERASRGGLPSERSEIYDTCESILLEHWQREVKGRELLELLERTVDGRQEAFDAEVARRVLQPVAYWLHQQEKRRHATVAELREPVAAGLAAVGRSDVPAEAFVRSFATESGLLTPYGPQRHGFIHLGFQEHLATLHVRERWKEEPEVRASLIAARGEGWWREVSRMVLEHAEPGLVTAFVEEVVDGPELEAWSRTRMLSACLRAAPKVAVASLEVLLGKAVGEEGVKRQLTAVRLLVQHVVPGLSAAEVEALDAVLRVHPVEAVRRRWLDRPKPSGVIETKVVHGVELVRLPGGWFAMGSAQDDDTASSFEQPQHEVELGTFWLAKTPVTNAQYREYLKAHPRVEEPEYWNNPGYDQPQQPVVGVSWHEARAYCAWAGLRLPTEAEWEYACRAGTTTRYCTGDEEENLKRVGWYGGNSGRRLHAASELEPNAWGLYDMHGNIWEWCEDAWGDYSTSAHAGEEPRHEPLGGANRVMRGGAFDDEIRVARSAFRGWGGPGFRWVGLGFRPAQGHL